MFKCQKCTVQVQYRQPENRIVKEQREKYYDKKVIEERNGRRKVIDIVKIKGWEIVKEISVCPDCFINLTGEKPKMIIEQEKASINKLKQFNPRRPRRKKWRNPKTKDQKGNNIETPKRKPIVEVVNNIHK